MCTALLPGRAYEHQSLKGKTKQYNIIYIYYTMVSDCYFGRFGMHCAMFYYLRTY